MEKNIQIQKKKRISFDDINLQVMRARDTHFAPDVHASRFFNSKSTIAAKLAKMPP